MKKDKTKGKVKGKKHKTSDDRKKPAVTITTDEAPITTGIGKELVTAGLDSHTVMVEAKKRADMGAMGTLTVQLPLDLLVKLRSFNRCNLTKSQLSFCRKSMTRAIEEFAQANEGSITEYLDSLSHQEAEVLLAVGLRGQR